MVILYLSLVAFLLTPIRQSGSLYFLTSSKQSRLGRSFPADVIARLSSLTHPASDRLSDVLFSLSRRRTLLCKRALYEPPPLTAITRQMH